MLMYSYKLEDQTNLNRRMTHMNGTKIAKEWQDALINQKDFLPCMMQTFLQQTIEAEFRKFINAKEYERTEERKGQRNGHYEQQLNTRVGTISLRVCRDRDGQFKTELFERYQRSEKALVYAIVEMYYSGISTRKVVRAVEELCGMSVSKSEVSRLVVALDKGLAQWRMRPLVSPYQYLIFDARYEKIRENGHVVSKAFVIAIGITAEGAREVIGCWIINSESFEEWDMCINSLRDRGLNGVTFAVTDDNKGLRRALQKNFQGVKLQRCQVHFMRNFMSKLAKNERTEGMNLLRNVFAAQTQSEAFERVKIISDFLISKKKEKVADWIESDIEETLLVLELPMEHRKKMKSTNMIERLNQELKRRSRVVRIFPNSESCLRLLGSICQEISEEWTGRIYLTK